MTFKIEITRNGLPINEIGGTSAPDRTVLALAHVFEEALNVAYRKASGYGMAWQRQGYMGNVARILSKTARIENLVWNDEPEGDDHCENVQDTLGDLVSIVAFALVNYKADNRWGKA